MTKKTLYQAAIDEQKAIMESLNNLNVKWLHYATGIDKSRIYRIRQGNVENMTWAEVQAIRRAIRTLVKNDGD